MSSEFGSLLKISVFGQSHGRAIGVVVDGLPAGEAIDLEELNAFLARRKPGKSHLSTARREADAPVFLSGLENGVTCGAPLCAVIENGDQHSSDYDALQDKPRPGHADYTAFVKWGGQADMRGGVTCRYGRLDDQGITVDSLKRSGADIAHISPNHHFPTGITMPASRRYEVLAWANEKEGRYLIEDDYDSEFRLGGRPVPTLFSIDACEKVIYMNTFSKSLTPTIRISYMVLPVHLANRFYEELSFYSCTVSNFEQYTLAAFIKQGYFEKHINRMRLYYARQRQKIKEVLEKGAPGLPCEIRENDSGLHFLLHLKTDLTDREVVKKLAEQGVRVHALSEYYTKNQGEEHFFIINYSNLDVEKAAAAMEIIADVTGGKL